MLLLSHVRGGSYIYIAHYMQNRQPTLYFVRTLGSNNIAFSRYCSRDGAKQTIESRQSSLYAVKDIRFNKKEDIQCFHLLDKVRELKPGIMGMDIESRTC